MTPFDIFTVEIDLVVTLILQKVKAQRLLGLLRELAEAEVEVAQVEHLARILDPHNDDRWDRERILNILK